jgi:hypothetical protein
MDSSFSALSKAVLKGMYNSHFKDFVRRKLVEQSQVKLGMTGGAEREGIGEIWCVSNPRLRDHPLVLVSEAFCKMTGYRAEAILGRNCRFLQGPGTSPGSVQRIRQAIAAGEEHTELLLNYRSSGEPFWNRHDPAAGPRRLSRIFCGRPGRSAAPSAPTAFSRREPIANQSRSCADRRHGLNPVVAPALVPDRRRRLDVFGRGHPQA